MDVALLSESYLCCLIIFIVIHIYNYNYKHFSAKRRYHFNPISINSDEGMFLCNIGASLIRTGKIVGPRSRSNRYPNVRSMMVEGGYALRDQRQLREFLHDNYDLLEAINRQPEDTINDPVVPPPVSAASRGGTFNKDYCTFTASFVIT